MTSAEARPTSTGTPATPTAIAFLQCWRHKRQLAVKVNTSRAAAVIYIRAVAVPARNCAGHLHQCALLRGQRPASGMACASCGSFHHPSTAKQKKNGSEIISFASPLPQHIIWQFGISPNGILSYNNMPRAIYQEDHKIIVDRLKQARLEAGLAQIEVAERLGRTQSYVSKIESGQRRFDVLQLKEFAKLYKKSLAYFVK